MASEAALRAKLAQIDELRSDAQNCAHMMTHWMGHDGELVTIVDQTVKVRRRWRSGEKTAHSEVIMTPVERDLFRDYLSDRARRKQDEANAITAILGGNGDD